MPALNLGPTLETGRLILRPPQLADFDDYAALLADEDAARYIGGHLPRAVAWRKFMTSAGAWALQGFAMFSVVEKASGRWIGNVGPWHPEGWPGNEVGWSLGREFWGQGFAREAAIAVMDWSFDHLGWTEVIHSIQPANVASIALAERLGSRYLRQARMPPPYEDIEVGLWGQTREQWRARAAGAQA